MTTHNPDAEPMNINRARKLVEQMQSGQIPPEHEIEELKTWFNEVIIPAVTAMAELFIEVTSKVFIELKRMVDGLPPELRDELYRRADLQAARDRHPAGTKRITTVSPLEKQLRLDTRLVPDGPDYMARREAHIQQRLSEAGVTANVMPLSAHPAYRPGRGRIPR
jgi:hypothetical protein